MRHPDADAKTAAIGIASGAVQHRFRLTVAAKVDSRGKTANILKPSPNGICVCTDRLRDSGGVAFNARINVESGKADPIAAAFQPTEANTVFRKSDVLGAQHQRQLGGRGVEQREPVAVVGEGVLREGDAHHGGAVEAEEAEQGGVCAICGGAEGT